MILRLLKKHDEQNELIEDDSDNIMNMNESKFKAIKFEEFAVKDKKRARNNNRLIVSKCQEKSQCTVIELMTKHC